jgi:hypothetical protein
MKPKYLLNLSTILGVTTLIYCWDVSIVKAAPKCDGKLTLPPSINLLPTTSQELVAGTPSSALSRGDLNSLPVLNTIVRRSLPNLWESQVAKDRAIITEYELIGNNGCQNCLSNPQNSRSEVLATIEPLPIVVEFKPGNGQNCQKATSGINLILDLKSVRHAGKYQGQLRVTTINL